MSQNPMIIRICHLDDEPWILSFLPRRIHLEVIRTKDASARLIEPSPTSGDRLVFTIEFADAGREYRIEYIFFVTTDAFLDKETGFVKKLKSRERNGVVILDLRIGDDQMAGRSCFQTVRAKLAPHSAVDWLFLTAYPGSAGLEGPEHGDRLFAKPPNRNDLFARIYAAVRELSDVSGHASAS